MLLCEEAKLIEKQQTKNQTQQYCYFTKMTQNAIHIENTTPVPVGDDLSYNEWFLKRI